MRPIKLTIKGLNSFIEEQTIDFNKLTDRGLFGIFGPTGSGKSTILDGITLALYGDIARKSSNFINTNCNDLNVSFTFQISGSPDRIYVVSRHFKRDKKTGNAKTHAAIVKEITGGNEVVLADSVKLVTETCKNIIGLSLEDFTRTVVLPQGKFSEFLKLEGKQRREMLERLFNLQDYGDKLAIKLNREISSKRDEVNRLSGEMNSYEEITEDRLALEKQRLAEVSGQLVQMKQKQEEVEARYKKGEEIWNMQKELEAFKVRKQELEAEAENIERKSQRVKQGESAARVYPILESYEVTHKDCINSEEEKQRLQKTQSELEIKKQEIESTYEKVIKEKNELLPNLQNKLIHLEEAIKEVASLEETEDFIKKVEDGLVFVVKDIAMTTEQEKAVEEQISLVQKRILKLQQDEKEFKIDETVRLKVQEGLRYTQEYLSSKKHLDKNVEDYQVAKNQKELFEKEKAQINTKLQEKIKQLEEHLSLQEQYLKNAPTTKEELLKRQEMLAISKEKSIRLEKLNEECKAHEANLAELVKKKEKLNIQLEESKESLSTLKQQYEDAKLENLAHILRAKLHEGGACPVCGSTVHQLENLNDVEDNIQLNDLEEKYSKLEEEHKLLERSINELLANETAITAQLKKICDEQEFIGQYFKDETLEQMEQNFSKLTKVLNEYETKKESIEQKSLELKEERLKLVSEMDQKVVQLEENNKQIVKLEQEIAAEKKNLEQIEKILMELKKDANAEDFEMLAKEIVEKDRKREEIATLMTRQSEEKEELVKKKEQITEHLGSRRIKLSSGLTKYDESQKKKQSLLASINKRLQVVLKAEQDMEIRTKAHINEVVDFLKQETTLLALLKGKTYTSILNLVNAQGENAYTGEQSKEQMETASMAEEQKAFVGIELKVLESCFNEYPVLGECVERLGDKLSRLHHIVEEESQAIEKKFGEATRQKEEIDKQFDLASKQLVEVTAKLEEFTKRLNNEKDSLDKALKEEDLTELEVKAFILTKEAIEQLRKEINAYQEEKSKLIGSMEAIANKLKGQSLEEKQWQALKEEKKQILAQVDEIIKIHINLTTAVKQIEAALVKLGELREKKQKLDHRLAILSDLEKLFKGKKFVEFVAATRLKYVSLEASKKLKEITSGNYGLEVDEDSKFIIRDYKNGGARRDASTLSGGETFLASLALALALSSEIQLKGTAPLELFFLDEGFGTLDDDLLEVVMSSLEKIHHDKLKVGIISHVEAIKNRVPVKLLLTPAEAGQGGTKVTLDRS